MSDPDTPESLGTNWGLNKREVVVTPPNPFTTYP